MSTRQETELRGAVPTATGFLSGIVAMLWLWSIGELSGYGLSAVLMLYVTIGGSITLIGVGVERGIARL